MQKTAKWLSEVSMLLVFAAGFLLCPALPVFAWDYTPEVNHLLDEGKKQYEAGRFDSAIIEYNNALGLEPNCPDAHNGLGLCARQQGDFGESIRCYQNAISLKPDHYNALYNLANNYYMQREYTEAINYYLKVLHVSQKAGQGVDIDLYASLANVYRDRALTLQGLAKQNDENRALEYYQKALEKSPSHPQAHANLGRFYLDRQQFGDAEKELRIAVAAKPKYAYAYYELGRLYSMRKEYPAALLAYFNSMKSETVDAQKTDTVNRIEKMGMPIGLAGLFSDGYENLQAGNWEAAAADFDSASKKNEDFKAVSLNNLAYSKARSGDLAFAIETYIEALKIKPHGLPELYYNLGQAYLQKKQFAKAEAEFNRCLQEAKGNHYLAHNALGIVLKQKGDFKNALNQYNLALLQSSNGLSVVQFNRGLVLEKLGQKREAIESYNKYLQAAPSGLNAAACRSRLEQLKK